MPDLQSELSKVLTQQHFDDEPGSKHSPTVIDDTLRRGGKRPHAQSNRRKVWAYIRDNENSTVADVSRGTGYTMSFCHSSIGAMFSSGRLTRDLIDGGYRYSTVGDSYEDRLLKREATAPKAPKAPAKPPTPAPTFDPDAVINQLNVLQAKELMVRLKQVFGEIQ